MELVPYRAQNLGASDGRRNFSPVDRSSTYSNSSRPPQKETLVESPKAVSEDGRHQDAQTGAEIALVGSAGHSIGTSVQPSRIPTTTSTEGSSQHIAEGEPVRTDGEPIVVEESNVPLADTRAVSDAATDDSNSPSPGYRGAPNGQTTDETAQSHPEATTAIAPEERLEGFEELLIYRACLYGTLMALTVDTSQILESIERSKIVQVL
jgi:hypothetical protein